MNAELNMKREAVGATVTIKPETDREQEARLVFPLDLSEWMPQENLMESITAIVEEMNWANPELLAYVEDHPEYRPKVMLRLITFSYATGVFNAEEIESNCFSDPFLRYISEGQPPRAREISRFRRANRSLLKWVLAQVFREVLNKKFELDNTTFPAGLRRVLVETAVERLDLARHLDRAGYEL